MVLHYHVPSYHPSSNDLAENMVMTVKQVLSKCKIIKDTSIEIHIACFLLHTAIFVTVFAKLAMFVPGSN